MPPGLATAWFQGRRWKDVVIQEQAIRLGSYGKALSLIWVPWQTPVVFFPLDDPEPVLEGGYLATHLSPRVR